MSDSAEIIESINAFMDADENAWMRSIPNPAECLPEDLGDFWQLKFVDGVCVDAWRKVRRFEAILSPYLVVRALRVWPSLSGLTEPLLRGFMEGDPEGFSTIVAALGQAVENPTECGDGGTWSADSRRQAFTCRTYTSGTRIRLIPVNRSGIKVTVYFPTPSFGRASDLVACLDRSGVSWVGTFDLAGSGETIQAESSYFE